LWSQLWPQLGAELWSQLRSQLWSQLGAQLESQLGSQLVYWTALYSLYDLNRLTFWGFPRRLPGFSYPAAVDRVLDVWLSVARNLGGFLAFRGVCFISERPTRLTVDERGRLHNEAGPAMQYSDGYCLYTHHGVRIGWDKAHIIETPESITVQEIGAETNAEVRRVMIERYGQVRYIQDSGAVKIHEDDYGVLYSKEVKDDEPILMVKVVNSTPELDGSYKDYWLRVNPELRPLLDNGTMGKPQELTARNAVASTFGKRGEEYALALQT